MAVERGASFRRTQPVRCWHHTLQRPRAQPDDLAALLAHDLRSPLAALRASSELLLDDISVDEQRQVAQYLVHQVEGLERITRDVITAVRSQARSQEVCPQPLDLAAAVQGIIADIRLDQAAQQCFTLGGTAATPAHPSKVHAVLRNILVNAVKYSPLQSTIVIRVDEIEGQAAVAVRDEGQGILPEDLPRIFERFYRAPSHQRTADGLGLGLYAARRLARDCGGDILVESTPGSGSTFTVLLPLAPRTRSAR